MPTATETRPLEQRCRTTFSGGGAHDEREVHVSPLEGAVVLGEVELLELEDQAGVLRDGSRRGSARPPLGVFVGEEADPDLAGEAAGADLG